MKRQFLKGFVFVLCYVAYVAIYAARLNLSMASPAMISGGILTEVQYGFIGSTILLVQHRLDCVQNGAFSSFIFTVNNIGIIYIK